MTSPVEFLHTVTLPAPFELGNAVFAGIDASAKGTGLCALWTGHVLCGHIDIPDKITGLPRMRIIRGCTELFRAMMPGDPVLTAYEEPLTQACGDIIVLGQALIVARMAMSPHDAAAEVYVNVARLKKFGCGLSGGDKSRMIRAAQAMINDFPDQNDMADAFHLACIAKALITGSVRTRKQAEVIVAITPRLPDNLIGAAR